MRIIRVLLIFFICFINLAFATDIQISVTVDRITVPINQTFTYSVEISGEKANMVNKDPKLPDMIEFATYMGSSGTSQNIQIINGQMSVSKSLSFTYMATKVGKYRIEPVELDYKGTLYKSEPIDIEIVAQAPQAQPPPKKRPGDTAIRDQKSIGDNLFLKATVNKKRIYVNEPLILNYKIYTRVTVTSYGISKLPNTIGFWVEEFPLGDQPKTYREIYNGQEYIVADIKKLALFPTDPGTKTISPMKIECDVRVQSQRRSIFDSFFDDPFFGRTIRQEVNSLPVTVEVLPLPAENRPLDFYGVVGDFSISANVDKNQIKTNEAVALKIKITGTGNIKVLPTPKVEIPPDFEQYEPKITEDINRSGNTISGNKIFEYVLIPRFPGIQKIKPVQISYFDINNKIYKTISTREIEIIVEKGSDEFITIGSGLSKEEVKLLGKDIRFIQKHQPDFRKIGRYFYNSPLFLTFIIIPLILVGSSVAYSRHLEKISGNIAYARSRKANQIAMKRLRKAKHLLSEKTQKEFFAELASALLGFLGDKFNISAAGIITDHVEEMMKVRNIDEQVISQYINCLHSCDYQRFAPSNSTILDMKQFYEQAKAAIISLEKTI